MIRTKTKKLTKIMVDVQLVKDAKDGNRGRLVDNGSYSGQLRIDCQMLAGSRVFDLQALVESLLQDLLGRRLSDFEQSMIRTNMKGQYYANFEFAFVRFKDKKVDVESKLREGSYAVMGKLDTHINACVCTIS